MTTEQMRTRLTEQYPTSDWAKKVKKMPDDQVQAIFLRLRQTGVIDAPKEPPIAIVPAMPRHIFYCNACQQAFMADNPDTKECRYCGSTGLTTKPPYIKIEKRNNNED